MACETCDFSSPALVKLLVLGEERVGVSSFVGAVSDFPPVRTREIADLLPAGHGDALVAGVGSSVQEVWTDFGSCTLASDGLRLGLCGAPGMGRVPALWPDLVRDALGAVVLAHSGRIGEVYPTVSALEQAHLPFVLAVNVFDEFAPEAALVREFLELPPPVPIVLCDARHRVSVKNVLADLVRTLLDRTPPSGPCTPASA